MKGDIMHAVLWRVSEAPALIDDLFIIFTAPYGISHRGLQRRLSENHRAQAKAHISHEKRRQVHNVLYQLRTQGLIASEETKSGVMYKPTKQGTKKLLNLRALHDRFLPRRVYETTQEQETKIIVFDVPERERRKRDWLRAVLKRIGFHMVQRSVWIGKNAIPEDFVKDLGRLNLIPYVKILAVTKKGNLTPLL